MTMVLEYIGNFFILKVIFFVYSFLKNKFQKTQGAQWKHRTCLVLSFFVLKNGIDNKVREYNSFRRASKLCSLCFKKLFSRIVIKNMNQKQNILFFFFEILLWDDSLEQIHVFLRNKLGNREVARNVPERAVFPEFEFSIVVFLLIKKRGILLFVLRENEGK